MRRADSFGAAQLCLASVNELSWQWLPCELQGRWHGMTQWLPIAFACFCAARPERSAFLSAAMLATAIYSGTTSICSAAWLVLRFETASCTSQCSAFLGIPMLILSALVAMLALTRWTSRE